MSKQRPPVLDTELAPAKLTELADADLDSVQIDGSSVAKQRSSRVRFNSVRIIGGDFSETLVRALNWVDVECLKSQFSMCEWPEAKLTRVVLRDSRATGLRLEKSELGDVRFVGCQLDYASFTRAAFCRVTFESCRLQNADFGGADLRGTTFLQCDLQGANFIGARLDGVDMRTSSGGDIEVEARDVKGLIVNSQQATALARLLGLVVRDA
jgi:uncharacterized protein YjbI with pentapeptide repeats